MCRMSCIAKTIARGRAGLVDNGRHSSVHHRRNISVASVTELRRGVRRMRRRIFLFSNGQRPDSIQRGLCAPHHLQGAPQSPRGGTCRLQAGATYQVQEDQGVGDQRRKDHRARRTRVVEGNRSPFLGGARARPRGALADVGRAPQLRASR